MEADERWLVPRQVAVAQDEHLRAPRIGQAKDRNVEIAVPTGQCGGGERLDGDHGVDSE
jgi:hypothetical protein